MNPEILAMIMTLLQQQQGTPSDPKMGKMKYSGQKKLGFSGQPSSISAGGKNFSVNANISEQGYNAIKDWWNSTNSAVDQAYANPYIPDNPNPSWTGGPYF